MERLGTYLERVDEAIGYLKEKGFDDLFPNIIEAVRKGIVELDPLLRTEADLKRFKMDVEKVLDDFVNSLKEGNKGLSLGNLRTLRDRVNTWIALQRKVEFH